MAFTLTGDIVRYAKQYGLMLGGKGYTLTKVYVESSGNTGSENSIWVGHIDGSANITIRSPHFKNANDLAGIAKGDVIRLTYAKKRGYSSNTMAKTPTGNGLTLTMPSSAKQSRGRTSR